MASLHYLTVQDVLWINLQVTKRVQHFNYARLEEATFYQYAYGESTTLFPQAARFVSGFIKMHPLEARNEATALVGCLTFLSMNGCEITASASELKDWFHRVALKQLEGEGAIGQIAKPDPHAHHAIVPDVRAAIRSVLERCEDILGSLDTDLAARQSA